MKYLQMLLNTRHRPPIIGYWLTVAAIAVFMCANPAMAAKKCPESPCHKTQQLYHFVFEGLSPPFQENDNGAPWEITGVAATGGRIGMSPAGPVPLYEDRIAAIGDYETPCGIVHEVSCAERLGGSNPIAQDFSFGPIDESRGWGNVRMGTRFSWFDPNDAWTEYQYVVVPSGWADLVAHPWDPTVPEFCVPMEFDYVAIHQSSPTIQRRVKQCRENGQFAICEAEETEGQFPLASGDFRATIWRADHPDYDADLAPLTPPCGFGPWENR